MRGVGPAGRYSKAPKVGGQRRVKSKGGRSRAGSRMLARND